MSNDTKVTDIDVDFGPSVGWSKVRARWGVVSDAGFQPVPDVLLAYQKQLQLRSEDLNVLLQVLMHWHKPERLPFPTAKRIAQRMGGSERTIERSLMRLRKSGFLTKVKLPGVHGSKAYDPNPMVEKLKPYAVEVLKKRAADRQEAQLQSGMRSAQEMFGDDLPF